MILFYASIERDEILDKVLRGPISKVKLKKYKEIFKWKTKK